MEFGKFLRDFGFCLLISFEGGKRKSFDVKLFDFDLFIFVLDEELFSNLVL